LIALAPIQAGLGSKSVQYVGGTWTQLKQGVEGKLDLTGTEKAVFSFEKGATTDIPFAKITSLEYGQKAGRRIGATIGWGVTTLGIAALPMLLSKKRKHFLSVGWTDADGKAAGVVLQLGKDITRATLKTFEVRSGKQIEYESEDAKKNIGN
jgi:hypothetical protein